MLPAFRFPRVSLSNAALAFTCAAALTVSAPALSAAPIPGGPAQAVLEFKAQIGARLATLKGALDVLDAQFADDLGALKDDVKNAVTTPSDAHVDAFELVNALDAGVAGALRTFTDGLESDASAQLADLIAFPNAFVVGDGGLIDGAVHKAAALRSKSTVRNFKKLKVFIAQLEKVLLYDIVVDRRGQVLEPVTPSETVTPADAPFVPLRIDLLVAGSDRTVSDDGRVCLAGTADVNNAGTVDVSITLPGGTPVSAPASVDSQTGRWSVCFPASGAGDLPEGNYSVTITQGDVSISDSIGVQ